MDDATNEFLKMRDPRPGWNPPLLRGHAVKYGGMTLTIEEKDAGDHTKSLVVDCPQCSTPITMIDGEFKHWFDRTTGRLSIEPAVACHAKGCGWRAMVRDSVVIE